MTGRNFHELLENRWELGFQVCVGLDSDLDRIPKSVRVWRGDSSNDPDWNVDVVRTIRAFNREIIEATCDLVCAFKLNLAFYAMHGAQGFKALQESVSYIQSLAPTVPVILDAKHADINATNKGYVLEAFGYVGADAITVHPYLGSLALKPFLEQEDKGIFILCRTSNKGAGEFQDRIVSITDEEAETWLLPAGTTMPLYQLVAYRVSKVWNKNGNCGLVVGATYPDELWEVRNIVGKMPLLIPGIGTQGADIKKTVLAGHDSRGKGMIINSSGGIIFAGAEADFADAAYKKTLDLHTQIDALLE